MFFPQNQLAFLGAAFGWLLVGLMIFGRSNAPLQYREAIKAMRQQKYKEAVDTLDSLIKEEPDNANHYRLRGRILRLWGKTGRARRDYESMIEYSPNDGLRAEAYNELSELELQAQNYDKALEAAQKAADLLPNDWIAAYNLGMVQDRLGQSKDVIESLQKALDARVKDSRHRLLIYLWMTRAYARLGQEDKAAETIDKLKKEQSGLRDWQQMLSCEEASVLQGIMAADVELAAQLISGNIHTEQLAQVNVS
jgi:tetratricopeptide (TPR) repeat protein